MITFFFIHQWTIGYLLCDADGSLVSLDASTIMYKIHFLGKNNGFGIYFLNHLEKDNSIRKKSIVYKFVDGYLDTKFFL